MRIYCINTSSLINLKEWRSPSRNPAVWRKLEELIRADRLIAPEAVLEELMRGDDPLARWGSRHKSMFKPDEEHVPTVRHILQRFPGLVHHDQAGHDADPFVVALAYDESRQLLPQECIGVTEEVYRPGRPRIPHVCQENKLPYRNIHQMFLDEGWSF